MHREKQKTLKIAIVGGGVSGIVASYLLQRNHEVTLFEKNHYLGGHTNTIALEDGPDAGAAIDTGFIVLNNKTYPCFSEFLSQIDVSVQDSDMSFGFYCQRTGLQYAGTDLRGLFAQKGNVLRASFLRMLGDIVRFGKVSQRDLATGRLEGLTLQDYVATGDYGEEFVEHYLKPMSAAIWSTSAGRVLDFPARNFIRFYSNHGLLSLKNRPIWQTVTDGSRTYVDKFRRHFNGKVKLNAAVLGVSRQRHGAILKMHDGAQIEFDRVVIATHADQALQLLADATPDEKRLLGSWKYSRNETVLHTDDNVMPPSRNAWASWNYRRGAAHSGNEAVTVTYHMNRLQRLRTKKQYYVTLNCSDLIKEEHVIRRFVYTHLIYSQSAISTQPELVNLNGACHTYFCGSYWGYGFHEDAVRSALSVARHFGIDL